MPKKIAFASTLVLCFVVCYVVVIANFSGKWTGGLKIPGQTEFPVNYTFKLDGTIVTGTASTPEGDIHIKNGLANGNDFSFIVPVNGSDVKNTCKYYPQGDSIGVNIDYMNYKLHATLIRDNK